MDDLIRSLNDSDPFAKANGIVIEKIEKGKAAGYIDLSPDSFTNGYVSSSLMAALGEKAAIAAALSSCKSCYCASSVFNVVELLKDTKRLKATAKKIHHGRRTAVYESEIFDDKDTLLAKGTYTIIISE